MIEKTEKKIIASNYTHINLQRPQVSFAVDRFDSAIIQKGYNVIHSRALRCPCTNRESISPLPNCENCNGLGWFYIESRATKALVQGMNNQKKFESWSETNAGKAKITSLYEDDVTYMDKFEITDLESNFSQILFVQFTSGILFAFTIYEPIKVMNIYLFQAVNQPLLPLYSKDENPSNWDYFIDKNKVVLNQAKYSFEQDLSLSIRYKHIPVYCVIDIMRELFKAKDKECSELCDNNDLSLRGMPQLSLAARLHYIFDSKQINGLPVVYDNTNYQKIEDNTVHGSDDNIIF